MHACMHNIHACVRARIHRSSAPEWVLCHHPVKPPPSACMHACITYMHAVLCTTHAVLCHNPVKPRPSACMHLHDYTRIHTSARSQQRASPVPCIQYVCVYACMHALYVYTHASTHLHAASNARGRPPPRQASPSPPPPPLPLQSPLPRRQPPHCRARVYGPLWLPPAGPARPA